MEIGLEWYGVKITECLANLGAWEGVLREGIKSTHFYDYIHYSNK